MRRSEPWLLVTWMWFLIALLPNIGLLQVGRQSVADRFTHLATIGFSVGVACALTRWTGADTLRARTAAGATFAVAAGLGWITVRQIAFWHDSVALFEHATAVEDSDYMRGDLATALMSQGHYVEAEPHLTLAVLRSPLVAEYHSNLANVFLRTGRIDRAFIEASIALRLEPQSIPAAETMGLILFRQGEPVGALRQFNRAVELGAPSEPIGIELNDMGASVASRGRPREAEPLIRRALELTPGLAQGWRNLVLVLIDQDRTAEARAVLQEAIRTTGGQAAYAGLAQKASQ
jgi:Flp pilus assembly protein TadD